MGVKLGNQCLKVLDFGKHNYTFTAGNTNEGFSLRLRCFAYGDEHEYSILEGKIIRSPISRDEVVKFLELLEARVLKLLSTSPEDLFERECLRGFFYLWPLFGV